ncbi:Type II secretory pathway ATPase GspE/PulE or T4P pilus assembly pathway ATPase PilB [Seinonella peptonophila]|uniref:Type II secretory pathway ATPase GspE/PulE or T4P pilus assembly pathway ATPase PilB n=1 Tax=Seinonella peptonophila TaxID=112248 RepID=A0A1M4V4Q2_9BACL|nr:GspE/PulE family protein [Seinonella peptonophila]SHE63858.1 Type II secretory pathway ATPase GspE/PulE or T4P pilus assembly pathway ATPase PilB [Seinonella peptonophila]
MINQAIEKRASDIHVEPRPSGLWIRQRIDGLLVVHDQIQAQQAPAFISRLKIMANLDIGEKRLPQDGTLSVSRLEGTVDLRVSTLPTIHGEKVVLRLFRNQMEALSLTNLGMDKHQLQSVERFLRCSHGLLITTGPTGSGKTTTLYALLSQLNQPARNIITLEDPIERRISGFNQVAIRPKTGLTFAKGLRAALRQDPDVIMVGEIRDRETAEIAIGAALTGHLVLSSLHTADSASVVTRLLDMQVEHYRVAAALIGVIAQRLMRLQCTYCIGKGCKHCDKTGYLHRIGIFEVMSVNEELERMIVQDYSVRSLRQYLRNNKIDSLKEVAMRNVRKGLTTQEEFLRVMSDVES